MTREKSHKNTQKSRLMKEISNQFCITDTESLSDAMIFNDRPFIPSAAARYSSNQKIVFNQSHKDTAAGIVWTLTFRATTQNPSVKSWHGRKAYVGFFLSDGSVRYIGTATEQPTVTVTPHPTGVYVVESTFDATDPIDL